METHSASDTVRRNVIRLCAAEDRPDWKVRYSDLARRLGWSRQRLSKLLNSGKIVTVEELLALAVALSVAPSRLLAPSDEDDGLEVKVSDRETRILDRTEALGWLAGVPAEVRLSHTVADNVDRYFEELSHTKVHTWHARRWFELVEHTEIPDSAESAMPDLRED